MDDIYAAVILKVPFKQTDSKVVRKWMLHGAPHKLTLWLEHLVRVYEGCGLDIEGWRMLMGRTKWRVTLGYLHWAGSEGG